MIKNFQQLEDAIDRVWAVQEFEQNDDGSIRYCFEIIADSGEDLVCEGEAESFEEFLSNIKWEYEIADDNEMFRIFLEAAGKRGYPSDWRDIVSALKSRKCGYYALYKAVKEFEPERM